MAYQEEKKDGLEALKMINNVSDSVEIQTIVDMGFTRDQAIEALKVSYTKQ